MVYLISYLGSYVLFGTMLSQEQFFFNQTSTGDSLLLNSLQSVFSHLEFMENRHLKLLLSILAILFLDVSA
jgi:hypothetical protein